MRLRRVLWSTIPFVIFAKRAFAQEGGDPKRHGTALHHLIEPEHVPLSIAVIVVVGAAIVWWSRRRARQNGRNR